MTEGALGLDLDGIQQPIVPHGVEGLAGLGVEHADAGPIVAQLHTGLSACVQSGQPMAPCLAGLQAVDRAAVLLRELIAGGGPLQGVGEVGVQRQLIVHGVGGHPRLAPFPDAVPLPGQAIARGVAAIAGIQRTPAAVSGIDPGLGHLVRGGPAGVVGHQRQRQALRPAAFAQAEHRVFATQPLRYLPGAVVAHAFDGGQQAAPPFEFPRSTADGATVAVLTQAELDEGGIEAPPVLDVRRTGRREVAVRGEVRPLAVGNAFHQLRHQEVEVGVALAMAMAGHVDRHAGHCGGEVGAMVQVEAAQEVLVGFAVA